MVFLIKRCARSNTVLW